MMAVSQNGWKASADRKALGIVPLDVDGVTFPGGVLAGDVHTILGHVARRFHELVEPLKPETCWGHAFREIDGEKDLSNHASGTAIDVNSPDHPRGKKGTFTAEQVSKIRQILDECGGVVRWGGDYHYPDEMHFEINALPVDVSRVAAGLRIGRPVLRYGSRGEHVTHLQTVLNRHFPAYAKLDVDGIYGRDTVRAVKEFQRRSGLAVDGVVGPKTWAALPRK